MYQILQGRLQPLLNYDNYLLQLNFKHNADT